MTRSPLRLGLTGGIGSGKSTVGQMLAARGATVLDADAICHLQAATVKAAAAFPASRMIGFDLIARGTRSWVLEANGFGDLLLDLRHDGRTTYEDQALLAPARSAINEYAHA